MRASSIERWVPGIRAARTYRRPWLRPDLVAGIVLRHLVRERRPSWVVVQCEAITDVDVTAAGMLRQLDEELNAERVHMAFVELRSRLQNLVQRYGLFETLDRDHFYPSMETALAAIRKEAR